MIDTGEVGELEHLWRVGHHADPLGFVPRDRCSWNHRFDDAERRYRTLYLSASQETCLREVLADLRPKAAAIARFLETFGDEAQEDLPRPVVPAAWRKQHVLASASVELDGVILDLCDESVRTAVEHKHAAILVDHGMEHLDLHELTARQRAVTQRISAAAWDDGVGVIRFPSSRDGRVCFAVPEDRASLCATGEPIPRTDPPPKSLVTVAHGWGLDLEPA